MTEPTNVTPETLDDAFELFRIAQSLGMPVPMLPGSTGILVTVTMFDDIGAVTSKDVKLVATQADAYRYLRDIAVDELNSLREYGEEILPELSDHTADRVIVDEFFTYYEERSEYVLDYFTVEPTPKRVRLMPCYFSSPLPRI